MIAEGLKMYFEVTRKFDALHYFQSRALRLHHAGISPSSNKSRDKADVNKRISDADEHQFECH